MKVGNLFQVKPKMFLKWSQKNLKIYNQYLKLECELCSGNHEADQCPHERRFSLEIYTTHLDRKGRFSNAKSRSIDYVQTMMETAPQYGGPAQSVNGRMNFVEC